MYCLFKMNILFIFAPIKIKSILVVTVLLKDFLYNTSLKQEVK